MAELTDALFDDVLAFIKPHMQDEDFRSAWLSRPLYNEKIKDDVLWRGTARVFSIHIIELLPHNLLIEAVQELGELRGDTVAEEAALLCPRIAAEAPKPTTYADPVQAYCVRVLDDPRLKKYRIDESFVRMRVLVDRGSEAEAGRWADSGIEAGDLPELLGKLRGKVPAEVLVVLGAPAPAKVCCCGTCKQPPYCSG
jgi:hypothetical protein